MKRMQKKFLSHLSLTYIQFVVLATLGWLLKKSNTVIQIDIAKQSNMDKTMVSKILKTLEEKGYITRQETNLHAGARTARLTTKGDVVLQKAIIEVENAGLDFFVALATALPSFNKNSEKLKSLMVILKR